MKTIKEITPNSIVIIRFCYQKSIQVINNSAYPVDISEWIVKIFNGLGTELFEYKFPAGASLPAKKIVNLWSKTAKGDRPVLRNDLILVPNCHRHNWSDKSIDKFGLKSKNLKALRAAQKLLSLILPPNLKDKLLFIWYLKADFF